MKNWINGRAKEAYSHNLLVQYVGGDPRIKFTTSYEEECYKNGELVNIAVLEESTAETKINTFTYEQIEDFLRQNEILPSEPSEQRQMEEL